MIMLDPNFYRHVLNPVAFVRERLRLRPDPLQERVLASPHRRGILCCTRQWGKSTITAAKAVHQAVHVPDSTILIAAPCERQSAELVRRCAGFLFDLGIRRRGDGHNRASLLLPNGSRIVGLPGQQELNIRGFSAPALILIDEAAGVTDELYHALVPMQATNDGALWLMSTPRERRGFFFEEWISPDSDWLKITASALDCPRISRAWLDRRARRLPKAVFESEFLCIFRSSHLALVQEEDLQAALQPLTNPGLPVRVYIGLDLGQRADHSALTVLYLRQIPTGRRNYVTGELEVLQHFEVHRKATLIVDAGGPGLPFIDFLNNHPLDAHLVKLNITGSGAPRYNNGIYQVTRAQLLTNLLLTEPRGLRSGFKSEADHDDLVMSLALAAWEANKSWHARL